MQYNLYFGVCKFCKEAEKNHMSDGKCVTRNSANQERVMCITTTTDGLLIAWGTDHGKICLISSVTADQLAVWKAHNGPVMDISFSPDSKKILSVGEDIHEPFIDDEQVRGRKKFKVQTKCASTLSRTMGIHNTSCLILCLMVPAFATLSISLSFYLSLSHSLSLSISLSLSLSLYLSLSVFLSLFLCCFSLKLPFSSLSLFLSDLIDDDNLTSPHPFPSLPLAPFLCHRSKTIKPEPSTRNPQPPQIAAAIDPKKIPRKHSVFCWNLEDWVKQRMKHRMVKKSEEDE
jgi:hypothetical protein